MPEPEQPAHPSGHAASWFAKAHDDIAVAELILANPIGARWAACFHAQQAAEKALKGLLVARQIDFPKTHSLELLRDLLPVADSAALDRDALARLTAWAVAGRYPEDIGEPTIAEATREVENAKNVLRIVEAP